MSAKLYVDQEHNALAVIEDHPDGVITVDHGFDSDSFDRVLAVMERFGGKPNFSEKEDGVAVWAVNTHRRVVLSSIEETLRAAGYSADDPLARRTVISVDDMRAMNHDVMSRTTTVSESVERGLMGHINVAFGALSELGTIGLQGVSHVRRDATDGVGRPLPLTRAQARLSRPVTTVSEVRTQLRASLRAVSDILVRASVDEADDGDGYEVEIALAPTRDTVSSFIRATLPAFESKGAIRGSRAVRFVMEEAPPIEAIEELRRKSAACTAATSIARPNSRTLVARIPCAMMEGSPISDGALSQRLSWVADQLAEYRPDLDHIGEVESVLVPEDDKEALRMLTEIPTRR